MEQDETRRNGTLEPGAPGEHGEPPTYIPPQVTTYTEAELLALLGPAQAGSVGGDNVFGQ